MTLTRRFAAAGELLGIPVLVQVVIGERRFASLKELGYLYTPIEGLTVGSGWADRGR